MPDTWVALKSIRRGANDGWDVQLMCGHEIHVRRPQTVQSAVVSWNMTCRFCTIQKDQLSEQLIAIQRS